MRFKDKAVLITGAASGIGAEVARRLAAEGARLSLIDTQTEALHRLAAELKAAPFICDVGDETDLKSAYDMALNNSGYIDAIVSCAGIMIYKSLADLTASDWDKVMRINFMAAVHLTQRAFSTMAHGGNLVYVGSIHTHQTSPLVAPYAAAKAALSSLARSASIEGKALGIRANTILPGAIDTPMLRESPNIKSGAEVLNADDIGQPQDIAAVVAFLLSEDARFVSGTSLVADGGRLARL